MPRPARTLNALKTYFFGNGRNRSALIYGLACHFRDRGWHHISTLFFRKLETTYGVFIHRNARLGRGVEFHHPTGIVIGNHVEVGDHVVIFQQVTLGGARMGDTETGRSPRIGAHTVIFAGARVLGDVTVGEHCIIGANAVVNRDVPPHHVAVGIPARVFPRDDARHGAPDTPDTLQP